MEGNKRFRSNLRTNRWRTRRGLGNKTTTSSQIIRSQHVSVCQNPQNPLKHLINSKEGGQCIWFCCKTWVDVSSCSSRCRRKIYFGTRKKDGRQSIYGICFHHSTTLHKKKICSILFLLIFWRVMQKVFCADSADTAFVVVVPAPSYPFIDPLVGGWPLDRRVYMTTCLFMQCCPQKGYSPTPSGCQPNSSLSLWDTFLFVPDTVLRCVSNLSNEEGSVRHGGNLVNEWAHLCVSRANILIVAELSQRSHAEFGFINHS